MPYQVENHMVFGWTRKRDVFCRCERCSNEIYRGEYYYDFDGDIVCEDCEPQYVKEHFRRCAE